MKTTLFSRAIVIAAAACCVSFVARDAAADVHYVVLSSAPGAPITDQLRAELGLKGFRVATFSNPPTGCFGDDLKNMAKDADGAICVDNDVQVFVRHEKSGALVHTDTVSAMEAADVAAIRSAEILRVRFEATPAPVEAAPVTRVVMEPGAPPEKDRAPAKDASKQAEVRFGAAGGVVYDPSSVTKPLYPSVGVSLAYRPSKRGVDLIATAGLFYINDESRVGGVWVAGGPRFTLAQIGDFDFKLGPSIGAMNVELDPVDKHTFIYGSGDFVIEWAATDHMSLGAEASVGYIFDQSDSMMHNPTSFALRGTWAF